MKCNPLFSAALTLALILLIAACITAQTTADKVEIGTQVTALTIVSPNYLGDATEMGFGGRITYNFNRHIAVEAEGNFFPHKIVFQGLLDGDGRAVQMQFGVKAGQRFRKFGVFGKVRPGLLSIGEVFSNEPGSTAVFFGQTIPDARISRKTHFTTDVGGVLELYPSDRLVVRFDAGDTIVRYGPHFEYVYPNYSQLVRLPAHVKHNFQFSAGVGFRLGHSGFPEPPPPDSGQSRAKASRFEAGIQFTTLSLNHPTAPCSSVCLSGIRRSIPEPGLGGRFTFNLNDSIALEAETNFFTRSYPYGYYESGHMFQSQFGVKAGKRFRKFGVFGKARPGFIGFTRVNQLIATNLVFIPVIGRQGEVGVFRLGPKKYFSTDVGGVIEFYISRRVLTRMDLGDTIIHYGERAVAGFIASQQIVRVPPETRHNLQFNAGIGFRF